jgi:hypothetical protein
MGTLYRGKFVGIGIDILAAVILTGVGAVFHMIVRFGSPLSVVEMLALGVAVFALLRGYLWVLDEVVGDVAADQGRAAVSKQPRPQAGRSASRLRPLGEAKRVA